jgi:Putative lumazine-binding
MRVFLLSFAILLATGDRLLGQTEEQQVLAVVQQLFDGMRSQDTARMRATLHPQARMVSPGMRDGAAIVSVDDPDRWRAAVAGAAGGRLDERVRNPIVHIDGSLASFWAEYTFYLGDRMSHCGVDTFHLVRMPEGWRIIDLADTRRTEGCTP